MNSVPYSYILEAACIFAGQDYSTLQTIDADKMRRSLSQWLGHIWTIADWPELRRYEQRNYRLAYDASTVYASGDQVWWNLTGKYYQKIKASAAGNAPTDSNGNLNYAHWAEAKGTYGLTEWSSATAYTAGQQFYYKQNGKNYHCHTAAVAGTLPTDTNYFGELLEFLTYVDYAQSGETAFTEVLRVTDNDPRLTTRLREYPFTLNDLGCEVINGPSQPWLTLRLPNPRLYGAVYSSTATYTGGQVYYATTPNGSTTGDFYNWLTANAGESPESAPTKWEKVEIPVKFENYLAHKAAADWLRADQQLELAAYQDKLAEDSLANVLDTLYRSNRQLGRSRVVTR